MIRIFRRFGVGLIVTALAFTMLSLVSTPSAQAARTCTTKVHVHKGHWKSPRRIKLTWGNYTGVRAGIFCSDGAKYRTTLQRKKRGSSTWRSFGGGDGYWSGDIKSENVQFRAVSTNPGITTDDIDKIAVKMKRKVKANQIRKTNRARFKIRPDDSIKNLKVTFKRKVNGNWKFYKRVRVNKKGVLKTWFHTSSRGIKYKMVLPKKRGFVKSKFKFRFYRN